VVSKTGGTPTAAWAADSRDVYSGHRSVGLTPIVLEVDDVAAERHLPSDRAGQSPELGTGDASEQQCPLTSSRWGRDWLLTITSPDGTSWAADGLGARRLSPHRGASGRPKQVSTLAATSFSHVGTVDHQDQHHNRGCSVSSLAVEPCATLAVHPGETRLSAMPVVKHYSQHDRRAEVP
jgi:hypothetical protein